MQSIIPQQPSPHATHSIPFQGAWAKRREGIKMPNLVQEVQAMRKILIAQNHPHPPTQHNPFQGAWIKRIDQLTFMIIPIPVTHSSSYTSLSEGMGRA